MNSSAPDALMVVFAFGAILCGIAIFIKSIRGDYDEPEEYDEDWPY